MSVIYVAPPMRVQSVPPLPGVLRGTTAIAGAPDTTVTRRVQLFLADGLNAHGQVFPTNRIVDWCWSDVAGNWLFSGLDPNMRYGIIAYDHTGQHDPVIKMNLVPTVD